MTKTVHTINAKGEILGRLATQVATLLRGKNKAGFTYHQDHGDIVEITNAAEIRVTGRKELQKKYYSHSGYLGGLKTTDLATLRQTNPEKIIFEAVKGMLPANRLRNDWLKSLIIYAGEKNDKN